MTNIVLIHSHDTGRYVQPYGYDVPTPNLQQFAEDGLLFRNAFCADPTCSPSRGALMTGTSPHSNGLVGLVHRGFSVDDYDQHLANHLSRNGYETALCGTQHEAEVDGDRTRGSRETLGYELPGDPGPEVGFELPDDQPVSAETERDFESARAAGQYIREGSGEPYFLSVGFGNTHRDFPHEDPAYDPDYVQPPGPIPDVPDARDDMAGYMTSAKFLDDCVGHVLDALRDAGDLDETLVVYTTDHGVPFKDMKCNLFDGGIGVSLIARFPDGPRGEVEDALVSHVDLFPTVCECIDVETPDYVEGSSMLPLVRGEADSVREAVFGEVTYHGAYEPKRCVRTERYKYIRRFDDEYERYVLINLNDGPSKEFLTDHGLEEQTRPREALYDLYMDPSERNNLVDDPNYSDVYAGLERRLESWMEETDDPLADGPVPKPDGARIHRRDCYTNSEDRFEDQNAR